MKPQTRLYAFMDGVDVTKFCTPKLVEVSMEKGVFQVGEEVFSKGIDGFARARVASINHKEGPFNAPTETYANNPYTNGAMPSGYSSSTTIVNLDLYSMSDMGQPKYHGCMVQGAKILGKSSGAIATISDKRLITDISADCQGTFWIPNFNGNPSHPKFETGTKVFTLVNDQENNQNFASCLLYTSPSPRDRG